MQHDIEKSNSLNFSDNHILSKNSRSKSVSPRLISTSDSDTDDWCSSNSSSISLGSADTHHSNISSDTLGSLKDFISGSPLSTDKTFSSFSYDSQESISPIPYINCTCKPNICKCTPIPVYHDGGISISLAFASDIPYIDEHNLYIYTNTFDLRVLPGYPQEKPQFCGLTMFKPYIGQTGTEIVRSVKKFFVDHNLEYAVSHFESFPYSPEGRTPTPYTNSEKVYYNLSPPLKLSFPTPLYHSATKFYIFTPTLCGFTHPHYDYFFKNIENVAERSELAHSMILV